VISIAFVRLRSPCFAVLRFALLCFASLLLSAWFSFALLLLDSPLPPAAALHTHGVDDDRGGFPFPSLLHLHTPPSSTLSTTLDYSRLPYVTLHDTTLLYAPRYVKTLSCGCDTNHSRASQSPSVTVTRSRFTVLLEHRGTAQHSTQRGRLQ